MLERGTGRAVVTDFGIARAAAGDSRLTVTGVAVGTPAYMSPEQALGERELDGRSDIYSLGVVGYQMLAGRTPFRAANTPAMLVKHLSETPHPVESLRPDVPPALARAVMRALAKKPEDRWSDAAEFRAAILDSALVGASTSAPPADDRPARAAAARARRTPRIVAAARTARILSVAVHGSGTRTAAPIATARSRWRRPSCPHCLRCPRSPRSARRPTGASGAGCSGAGTRSGAVARRWRSHRAVGSRRWTRGVRSRSACRRGGGGRSAGSAASSVWRR